MCSTCVRAREGRRPSRPDAREHPHRARDRAASSRPTSASRASRAAAARSPPSARWSGRRSTGLPSRRWAARAVPLGHVRARLHPYLLLSGRLPFEGDDRLAIGLRRAHEDPLSLRECAPHVPEGAATLVDSLLRRDPSRRPDAPTAALAMVEAAQLRTIRLARGTATRESDAPTAVLASQAAPEELGPTLRIAPTTAVRPRRRLLLLAATGAAAAAAMGVLAAARFEDHGVRAPSVVRWRATAARTRILRTMPTATVSVLRRLQHAGRAEPRDPAAARAPGEDRGRRGGDATVSKGSPFAEVPAVAAGTPAAAAKTVLRRNGFRVRYRYTPSWSVRKGTVIELQPGSGTRVRRPATMSVIVSSGFPRAVVPDVQNVDLETAQAQLAASTCATRSCTAPRRRPCRTRWSAAPVASHGRLRRPPCLAGRDARAALEEGVRRLRHGCVRERSLRRVAEVAYPVPPRRRRFLGRDDRVRVGARRRFLP